ncbi:uncharacterized protein LOC110881055 [Helianthus annuus]|uniref:uncharacterized protein LOC110881055 n=1 Tax=Helianthus annuus TaxID=4232 RepID=UPI0016533502|nr:uncharacterized protein LOC110881055 [Helianthus annuus]
MGKWMSELMDWGIRGARVSNQKMMIELFLIPVVERIRLEIKWLRVEEWCVLAPYSNSRKFDDCLLIHKPSLAKDTTKIKVTGKDQKLSFYAFTSVLKTDNWSGPRYLEKEFSKSSSSKQSCSQVISNAEDEFLNAEDFVMNGFIASIDVEKKVIIVGTVIAISIDKPWYYLSCNVCKKQIEEKTELVERDDGSFDVLDDKSFECINPDCDAVDIVPVHRYKIPLRVQDSTGTISCTLFDYEAIKLLKKTSKELLDIYSKVDTSTEGSFQSLPSEFDVLLNKKFAFQIKISSFNITNQVENYGISMLSSDEDLLSALEKKWKVNESDFSVSNVQSLSDSVGNVKGLGKFQESQSVMGDSVTPDPIDGSDQEATKFDNIKRNLEDVYDVDAVDSSSTKRRNSPGKVEINDAVGLDLLTPKIEK